MSRGFTLIELCLVLALLAVAAALVTPALSRFIRGRALDAEARRLLSLTRAAQARAVADGFPVLLWFDTDQSSYGAEEEASPGASDPKAQEFAVSDSVRLAIPNATPAPTLRRRLPAIRFLPDGGIDEISPAAVTLADASGKIRTLAQTSNRLRYEIR